MKFFQTVAYSLTTWLLAALVNGLLFALFFAMIIADANGVVSFLPVVMCSLIFSAPGVMANTGSHCSGHCWWQAVFVQAAVALGQVFYLAAILTCTG
jgi:hypothetical protein